MKMNKFAGVALGGFMAATGAQAQPVPELYGHPGIPDDNPKINCVREAMYYFAGGNKGMTQNVFNEEGAKVYHFETSGSEGMMIGRVTVAGPRTSIDVFPEASIQSVTPRHAAIQNTIYSYIVKCDRSIQVVPK